MAILLPQSLTDQASHDPKAFQYFCINVQAPIETEALIISFVIAVATEPARSMLARVRARFGDEDRAPIPILNQLGRRTAMAKTQAAEMRVKRGDTQVTAAFDPSQTLNGIEPIFQASNKLLETWMAVGSEILEFSRARLDRNLEVGKAIARSSSIDEAIELQADHARSTVREYFSEAGKIADLGTRALLDSFSVWQPAMRESARRAASTTTSAAAE
jgi:predicted kinase